MDGKLCDAELLELVSSLQPEDFYPVGLKLNYDKATLRRIWADHSNDEGAAFKALILSWENYVSVKPKTARQMLADTFAFIERDDLAQRIKGQPVTNEDIFEYTCKDHKYKEASFYCRKCKAIICERCLEDNHKSNTFVAINDFHVEIKQKLKTCGGRIEEVRGRLEKLRDSKVSGIITATHVGIQVMKEGVFKAFSEAHDLLAKERDLLLEKATVLEKSASPNVYGFALSKLKTCEQTLKEIQENGHFANDADKFESAVTKIEVMRNALMNNGPLMNLNKLVMKFVPCPAAYLGHLEEVSGWEFVEQFDLPEDKKEEMNVCIKLTDRKVVVGYRLGGADIINLDTKKTSRIAYDIRISSMALMNNGNLILCTTDNKLGIITQEGRRVSSFFFTQKTNKPCCVCVDSKDTVYMGYSEFSNIEVFEPSGGFIKNIGTVLQPWCMSIMKSGHIAVTECTVGLRDAVEVMSQDGRAVGHIVGRVGCSPFSTCDEMGNLFVAMVTNDGRATIRKYAPTGEHLESVVEELQLEWHENREWLQLACLTPNEFVFCDRGSVYIYRRKPTLSMMSTILGDE